MRIGLIIALVIAAIIYIGNPSFLQTLKANLDQIVTTNSSADPDHDVYVFNGQSYRIPRQFFWGGAQKKNDGSISVVSFQALLPEFSGVSEKTRHCFTDPKDPCNADVVTASLYSSLRPMKLDNIRALAVPYGNPEEKDGPCGLKFYESVGSIDLGGTVFQYFWQAGADGSSTSIARCPKEGSSVLPLCNADETFGDGSMLDYRFDRSKICEWPQIGNKLVELVNSFKTDPDAK